MDGPSDAEKRQISSLVWGISQRFGVGDRGWDVMVSRIQAPVTTAKAWKPTGPGAQPPGVPNGYTLLKILRLGGVLDERFQIPNHLEAALRAAEAAAAGGQIPPLAQGGQGKDG